jgi:hypothetical protein
MTLLFIILACNPYEGETGCLEPEPYVEAYSDYLCEEYWVVCGELGLKCEKAFAIDPMIYEDKCVMASTANECMEAMVVDAETCVFLPEECLIGFILE